MAKSRKGTLRLPNACTLYWEDNEVGGRRYSSDEVGGGVHVWDTALVDRSTLLAALLAEETLEHKAYLANLEAARSRR